MQASKQTVVSTGYTPRPLQAVIHRDMLRFNVLVCHRRFGKTVLGENHKIDRSLKNLLRNPQYAYIAPTYKQAKRVAWQYLVDFTRNIPGVRPNKSDLTVYIDRDWRRCPITGEKDPDVIKLMLIGADDPDDLRGLYLDGAVIDEFAQCNPIVWGEIVRPALSDRAKTARELAAKCGDSKIREQLTKYPPWGIFIGTPKGQNHFYRRYMKAKGYEQYAAEYRMQHDIEQRKKIFDEFEHELGITEETVMADVKRLLSSAAEGTREEYLAYRKFLTASQWFTSLYKASETGILSRDEIEEMSEDLEPEEVEQELECSFNAAIKGSYFSHKLFKARNDNRITHVPYDPAYPVDTFWDLGINDSMTIWFVQRKPTGWFYIDYEQDNGKGAQEFLKLLLAKGYLYGRNVWPHDASQRDLITAKSRLNRIRKIANEFGLRFEQQQRMGEGSQIEAARVRIDVSWFDESKCQLGLDCLYNYQKQWDDKLQVFKDKPVHDWASHGSKSFCYSALDDKISVFEGRRRKNQQEGNVAIMDYDEFKME